MTDPSWMPHRRGRDRELLGWLVADGDGFAVVDLLGRRRERRLPYDEAAALLDELGIGYLADRYEARIGGEWVAVRIAEVRPDGVRVRTGMTGAIDEPTESHLLPFPPGDLLRPHA